MKTWKKEMPWLAKHRGGRAALWTALLIIGSTGLVQGQAQTQAQEQREVDFIARIGNSPEITKGIGLSKLSEEGKKQLNSLLNAAYTLGFQAGAKSTDAKPSEKAEAVEGDTRVGGIQRDRPCGPSISKDRVELIQIAPEDASNVYAYAEKNGLEIMARVISDLGAMRTIAGTGRADAAKRGCSVVFHMSAGPGTHGFTIWNEFTKSYQTLKSQAVVYWFAMPKPK
jgi:hypothetical protein